MKEITLYRRDFISNPECGSLFESVLRDLGVSEDADEVTIIVDPDEIIDVTEY